MIRRGKHTDIPAIVRLMAAKVPGFLNFGIQFAPEAYEIRVRQFIGGRTDMACFVSEINGEVAAAILVYAAFHPTIGETVGNEATWVSDPRHPGQGRAVLKAAEEWYKQQGCLRCFAGSNSERTNRLLELLGFHHTERVFEKVL
jgi:GNAT superfamily N-acetyltransferase